MVGATDHSRRRELDNVVRSAQAGCPQHDEVSFDIECKCVASFTKHLVRGALGLRSELSRLSNVNDSTLSKYAAPPAVQAEGFPLSELWLAYIDNAGAGYGRIVFVSSDARHLAAMEKFTDHHFEQEDRAKLYFASPKDAIGLLTQWCGTTEVKTVRGYTVRTRVEVGDSVEHDRRRATVASVIAKSLRKKNE